MQNSHDYQQATSLAQNGDFSRAYEYIVRHLESDPQDGKAWNDAGVILHNLGKSAEAIDCFHRAVQILGQIGSILVNLAYAHIAIGQSEAAVSLFDKMTTAGMFSKDVAEKIAHELIRNGDLAGAMESLVKAAKILPDGAELWSLTEKVREKRANIAFFCGGDGVTFLQDIGLFAKARFNVRFFEGNSVEQVQRLMEWSDISWFEWATNFAEIGSQLPKVCKNIVRLHRYEAYMDWPSKINWANIDALITVGNPCVDKVLCKQVPDIGSKTKLLTIPNGVDMQKYQFVERQKGKNIAFIGNLRMVKNPMLLIQCMHKLHNVDSEYKLFFAGKSYDIAVEEYIRHMVGCLGLEDSVFFDGWQDDINGWLADKHYIACSSIIESQGMGILEGMARGLKPVVHSFPGAEHTFAPEFLFSTAEEFCKQVLGDDYQPYRYREFVQLRYSLSQQLEKINRLFLSFEGQLSAKSSMIGSTR